MAAALIHDRLSRTVTRTRHTCKMLQDCTTFIHITLAKISQQTHQDIPPPSPALPSYLLTTRGQQHARLRCIRQVVR